MLSKDNPWLLAANGKPRNPLSFTPFMGGKRMCVGKTFAEIAVKFTIPMLYHCFDFELVDPTIEKPHYSLGCLKELDL